MELVWAPERIGEGRRFRVIIRSDAPVRCFYSKHLELVDRTPEAHNSLHFLYFRSVIPTTAAEIRCESGSESIVVRLPVIAEADWEHDARLHEIPLPRIWPMERTYVPLKNRHTLVDESEIGVRSSETQVSVNEGHAVDSAGSARRKQGDRTSCEALEWPDEEIWNL
ncbi:MAG TPA: hypothetical protein PK384_10820, partial [Candidatus Latescibacteria bacterium]|nr:hypothetical protein [Candidatus Latescibacterota bacterium]